MNITIREVKTRKQLRQFIQFANDLYADCPYYCPPLFLDEMNTLRVDKNPAFEVCEAVYYLAYRGDELVGRIAGIINHNANAHWQSKKVRFGWFDFVDDKAVSRALLDAVAAWGKSKGMDKINGPVGFSDMDHQGLLLEGYAYVSPMAALYNYPYYVEHYQVYGLEKEADWVEMRFKPTLEVPERLQRVGRMVMERYHLRMVPVKSAHQLLKEVGYTFFDLVDEAYQKLYNYAPLTVRQKRHYSHMYFPLLNYHFVSLVKDARGELIAMGVGMPNISQALRKTKGRLFPLGWWHLWRALRRKQFDELDLLLIAVKPQWQGKGVNALLFCQQLPYYSQYGIKYANCTATLETNTRLQTSFEYFEGGFYKRRRAYVKSLIV